MQHVEMMQKAEKYVSKKKKELLLFKNINGEQEKQTVVNDLTVVN